LLILENGAFYPVEIKKTATPRKEDIASFVQFDQCASIKREPGALVCTF
jgi:hypothetical protein